MSVIDPVENDVRLLRQKVRRQEVSEADIKTQQKKADDSANNATSVELEDDPIQKSRSASH